MERIFGKDGILAHALQGYETRASQQIMAEEVGRLLCRDRDATPRRVLAVEAGTGVGKTLAYLVPAALSRRKVIVSTNTITLQDQIARRDIPLIKKHLVPEMKAMRVKGRQNYLCLFRWHQLFAEAQTRAFDHTDKLGAIADWSVETTSGDRAELGWLTDTDSLWQEIHAGAGRCLGTECPDLHECFITRLRRRAAKADILVVNHHLFFSDLSLKRSDFAEVLPHYEAVIFDEAHHLEQVAGTHFGISLSQYQFLDFSHDLEKAAFDALSPKNAQEVTAAAAGLAKATAHLAPLTTTLQGRFLLEKIDHDTPEWVTVLEDILTRLTLCADKAEETGNELLAALSHRARELANTLSIFLPEAREEEKDPARFVFWGERRTRALSLHATPIEVAPIFQEHLWNKGIDCILTSATLSIGGDFGYFCKRLGLQPDDGAVPLTTISLDSPYDFQNRTRLYLPEKGFPEPSAPGFNDTAAQRMAEILQAVGGRTLILFTSRQNMHAARPLLESQSRHPLLMQGDAPKNILLQRFTLETDSVLLAVASFWEGIDVPGDSLSCVIIDKLPFEVPTDPVIMARVNALKTNGENPFFTFQVPRAVLALRQGVGRLVRTDTDSGLIALLDVRLCTKGYGKTFLTSLPPSPVIRTMEEVRDFCVTLVNH